MRWLDVDPVNCPVGMTLGMVGEKWTLLIVRDAVNGVRRFDEFRRHIGLSEAVLSDRLQKLVAAGILETRPYREEGRRERNEYHLTPRGWDLLPSSSRSSSGVRPTWATPTSRSSRWSIADCGGAVRAGARVRRPPGRGARGA